MKDLKQKLIRYMKREGIDLRTDTKARGNLGLFSENRIDIHRKLDDEKFVEVLMHEYAHLIHKKLENDMAKSGGKLGILFNTDDGEFLERVRQELVQVTCMVDENALFKKLDAQKYAYKIKEIDPGTILFVDEKKECIGCAMCAMRCPDVAIVEVHK